MSSLSWAWEYFYTDGKTHGNAKSGAKNAWCNACIKIKVDKSQSTDRLLGRFRTGEERHAAAMLAIAPWKGKPQQHMVPHLIACDHVLKDIKARAWKELDRVRHEAALCKASDENTPLAPPPLSRNNTLPSFPPRTPFNTSSSSLNMVDSATTAQDDDSRVVKKGKVYTVTHNWEGGILQKQFNCDLALLLLATGSSWNFAANPEYDSFFRKWVPGCSPLERRVLAGPVLDELAESAEA
ncbi:hypothetical protein FA13DRAFT_1799093 [Coprinellus micaceus]|uniref:Uncharacterized protein n=1 Tax=Coprinellus micaceus TaxID=71717 RepID=A0A4Y7SKD3_COPMI|nr:hypothetical protein FA13DRAFT_1799093 [Coprinellus micaceus]